MEETKTIVGVPNMALLVICSEYIYIYIYIYRPRPKCSRQHHQKSKLQKK